VTPAAGHTSWPAAVGALAGSGHQPSRLLVLATALVALVAVVSPRLWPVTRTVVTLAHEGGHALVALLAGRRVNGVRVMRSTAGVTVSEGHVAGPGIVLTTAAGYLAPPLLGLGAAALLVTGHLAGMLILILILVAALAVTMRNAFGIAAAVITGAAIAAVLWRGSALAESVLGYLLTWFLLFGGVRPVLELQRARRRRRDRHTDADQLAQLTGVPAGLWAALFGLAALAAVAVSAFWLVP
jgi:peptidase M50B-like protein